MAKLKVGDKLPKIEGQLSYRCRHWEAHNSNSKARFNYTDFEIFEVTSAYYYFDKVGKINNTYNFMVKIEDIDKHIKDETMKYKSFAISGTKSLLKAMEEELNLVGYKTGKYSYTKNTESNIIEGNSFVITSNLVKPSSLNDTKTLYCGNGTNCKGYDMQFQLPQQWEECLAFCKGQLEPELKVGDWIYFLKSFDGKSKGYITQVENIKEEKVCGSAGWVTYRRGGFRLRGTGNGYTLNVDFRLATKEEIEKATSITVGGYKMEITNGKAKFGCQYITKEEVITLRKFLGEPYHAKISMRNTEITTDLLNKILDRL